MKAIGQTIDREKRSWAGSLLNSSICETHWSVFLKEENSNIFKKGGTAEVSFRPCILLQG